MQTRGRLGQAARVGLFLGLSTLGTGCAGAAPEAAIEAGARSLHCQGQDLEWALNRETSKVREYVVGCNFTYTRVHCREGRCYTAAVEPPCLGMKECFEEDPVTLEWKLASEVLRAELVSRN